MEATVRALCPPRSESDKGPTVLNVGFGLGIVSANTGAPNGLSLTFVPTCFVDIFYLQIDSLFQSLDPPPSRHVIIEPHPDVLAHMRSTGWYNKPGVEILEGRWQDFVTPEKVGELIGEDGGFDIIYTDTFAEGYKGRHKYSLFQVTTR